VTGWSCRCTHSIAISADLDVIVNDLHIHIFIEDNWKLNILNLGNY